MNTKKEFIHDVIFSNSIQGAFQHIKIFPNEWTDDQKIKFRSKIRILLDEIVEDYSSEEIQSDEHLRNISKLVNKGGVNFGVAQKLLNLYLKYLWCLEEIKIPPHCPIDSRILSKVGLPNIRWSKMDKDTYKNVVSHVKEVSRKNGFKNISDWELKVWNAQSVYKSG